MLMKKQFETYRELYSNTLTRDVIPYWLRYAKDPSGALNNCLAEDGTVLSKDRYIWSQGRALWTFSAMYNRVEQKQEYLDMAHGLFRYLCAIGPGEDGKWNYRYDENGRMLDNDISIYVDGFVLAGMTEYYLATGNERALELALAGFESTWARICSPGSYRVAPYVIPEGTMTHGVHMIFSFFYEQLGKAAGREDIRAVAHRLALEVLEKFYVEEKDAILEFVTTDGQFIDRPEGRACVPGHAMECMWFLITLFEERGEAENIQKCCRLIRRHLELAWDEQRGGLRLALDIDGKEPVFWQKATYKPWWVQCEALVATAYAYKHTKDPWYLDMHQKVQDYAFAHYPNGYGDWYNWLQEDGSIGESAALPVKDPFHLPRALIYLRMLWDNME